MKKIAFTMVSMLVATGAMAAGENATLTTKNYVDSGLSAVYQKAKSAETKADEAKSVADANVTAIQNLQTAIEGVDYSGKADQADLEALQTTVAGKADASTVNALSDKVNNATTGLDTKASQAALDALQQQVNGIDTTEYIGTNGVAIDAETHQVSLNVTAETGKMYVYTSTGWDEIPVADTWDANILTSGN